MTAPCRCGQRKPPRPAAPTGHSYAEIRAYLAARAAWRKVHGNPSIAHYQPTDCPTHGDQP